MPMGLVLRAPLHPSPRGCPQTLGLFKSKVLETSHSQSSGWGAAQRDGAQALLAGPTPLVDVQIPPIGILEQKRQWNDRDAV